MKEHLFPEETESLPGSEEDRQSKSWKIMCLGGGAGAEIVALAGVQKMIQLQSSSEQESAPRIMEIDAVDVANWSLVVESLDRDLKTTPPLSKYASAATKAANAPLLDEHSVKISSHQCDVLAKSFLQLLPRLEAADLVTLLFTLNELYSTSLAATQRFLWSLTERMKLGSLLLVIDSPGSYSSVTLNGAEKKYPMQWLLDHTLLRQPTGKSREKGKEEEVKWVKVQEDESRWFRLDERLEYPIDLENMRMQLHLYRRVEGVQDE
jgi:25S rRNA (uracil2843-N3)-methyltransferase